MYKGGKEKKMCDVLTEEEEERKGGDLSLCVFTERECFK